MMLFKSGHNLSAELFEFIKASKDLFIYVPYIKLEPLKQLLNGTDQCKAIVVRWEPNDLIVGASDIEVFSYCKEKGIKLFRNPRLHLKAFVSGYSKCFLGSPNISSRALNLPPSIYFNYEVATVVDTLSFEDRLYFSLILDESILITDSLYSQIIGQLQTVNTNFQEIVDFDFPLELPEKDFLISSLPMSSSVKTLQRVYLDQRGIHEEELNCAMHDIALYKMRLGLDEAEFVSLLKKSFFEHAFIKKFIQMIQLNNGEIYFGQAKAWIQNNCVDVPTPRRWEITENLQILFKWFIELGDDIFKVDRPSYSERLYISNN